jgi:hypothetical protein
MKKVFTFIVSSLILVLVSSLINGCASRGEDNRFTKLLRLLPASAKEDGCFFLIDYKTLWAKYGITFPEIIEDNNALLRSAGASDALSDTGSHDAYVLKYSSYYTGWGIYTNWTTHSKDKETPVQKNYLGYDIRNIDAEINNTIMWQFEWYEPQDVIPIPDLKVAAIGHFDPESIESVLSKRDGWPEWAAENYSRESYRNVTINSWLNGIDNHTDDRYLPPNLDQYGRAMPFAVSSENLFVSNSVQNIKSMIDSNAGKSSTLADVSEYALVTEGLYKLGAYVAIIGDEALANGQSGSLAKYHLTDFLTFGTGFARDEKGTYITIVLVHDSNNKAKTNVELLSKVIDKYKPVLKTPGSDKLIYDTQISSEGKVLLAKLYTDDPVYWSWWLISGDEFLYHEN